MAKTFEVTLGGRVRRLAFHQRDAIELKKRFGRTPHFLIFHDVLGLNFEGLAPGESPRMNPALFDPEVQFAVLHKALLRGGWNVTEDRLMDLVDEAVQGSEDGKRLEAGDFFAPAAKCALYSGAVTGRQVDIEEAADGKAPPAAADGEGGAEGNG